MQLFLLILCSIEVCINLIIALQNTITFILYVSTLLYKDYEYSFVLNFINIVL